MINVVILFYITIKAVECNTNKTMIISYSIYFFSSFCYNNFLKVNDIFNNVVFYSRRILFKIIN